MHVSDLADRSQDYLKEIWNINEHSGAPAPLGELAARVGQKTTTASEAIRRLAAKGLVIQEPYKGAILTAAGQRLAMDMVRRHRLLETFLVQTLGYTWDEVHEDAESLEHSVSDRLMSRIDAHLGHPERDPHGDPIPDAAGQIPQVDWVSLAAISPGQTVTVEQANDHDPQLLRYLAEHGMIPGSQLTVLESPAAGMLKVQIGTVEFLLAESALAEIRVRRDN
ncbi:metal-dependent transcriptional regulator [Corynebacterium alimapuense]|uniref:Diphtheria toxin repressor n=1 Tax=Corynebacterium alimapuense TaxID=1576874 RepID=A0A3M8K4P1_9CORY|nr:metal-dependent transcriptional regulator [Corynebacterium alimapuense]RNE48171.1 metal-dependent transcriptional regulator [Corynebacterium alimapuense]